MLVKSELDFYSFLRLLEFILVQKQFRSFLYLIDLKIAQQKILGYQQLGFAELFPADLVYFFNFQSQEIILFIFADRCESGVNLQPWNLSANNSLKIAQMPWHTMFLGS